MKRAKVWYTKSLKKILLAKIFQKTIIFGHLDLKFDKSGEPAELIDVGNRAIMNEFFSKILTQNIQKINFWWTKNGPK